MNFLEICRRVNLMAGIQGSIDDTSVADGIQGAVAESVRNAWIDIQNYRSDWTFMADRVFWSTVAGQEVYTPQEVFGVAPGAETNLGHYMTGRMMKDYQPLHYVPPFDYPLIDNTNETVPTWFTVEPSDNRIYMELPNDVYDIVAYYFKKPQILTVNSDTPDFPEQYHDIITYKALEYLGVYIGNSELYQEYSKEYAKALGTLMRAFIPARSIPVRGIV